MWRIVLCYFTCLLTDFLLEFGYVFLLSVFMFYYLIQDWVCRITFRGRKGGGMHVNSFGMNDTFFRQEARKNSGRE